MVDGDAQESAGAESVFQVKRVWILGSGFSKPLGGPLFDELLTEPARLEAYWSEVRSQRPRAPGSQDQFFNFMKIVNSGFLRGYRAEGPMGDDHQKLFKKALWRSAEEFLSVLGSVVDMKPGTPSASRELLNAMSIRDRDPIVAVEDHSGDITPREGHLRAAKAAICLDCERFVFASDHVKTLEQWQPYLRWSEHIGSDDTLITFNYDTAIEALFEPERLLVPLPCDNGSEPDKVSLLKLHGSASWRINDSGEIVASNLTDHFKISWPNLAIGVPGPEKMVASTTRFSPLWDAAISKIIEAFEIYIVGYRFPESDTHALMKLTEAIRVAAVKARTTRVLTVNLVLGPSDPCGHKARLMEILGWLRRPRGEEQLKQLQINVNDTRLFAQDFFALWSAAHASAETQS